MKRFDFASARSMNVQYRSAGLRPAAACHCMTRWNDSWPGRVGALLRLTEPCSDSSGFTTRLFMIASLISLVAMTGAAADFGFVHPGLLHSREDLARMKAAVAARQEPILSGYEVFRNHPQSQSAYTMRGPGPEIGRNPSVNFGQYDSDANAAYQCAIQWAITGDMAYANKSKEIIDGWSSTLKSVTGRDAVLMAGLGPFKMVNAAEIIRHTDAGWSASAIRRTEQHFKDVIYPALQDFAPFANGNWDGAAIKTMLAIGVFCNDRAIFERALRYYVNGHGNGRLTHYIINDAGQCQESGRDMPHTQLGLALLGDSCEIAWNQGLDLYGYADNRLLKGFEYTAKYSLGNEVPFIEWLDRTGKYRHRTIATQGRERLRAVFEQIYNHYVNRMGLAAPFTQQAAERVRPEGPGQPGADHPGFGTLLFTRPRADAAALRSQSAPASPAALIAEGDAEGNRLKWIAAVGATGYNVNRSTNRGGPYTVVARNVASPLFTDPNVDAGRTYYYTVSALNGAGESPGAFETGISAGPPRPWMQRDIGAVQVSGSTYFDGTAFTLEGAGTDIGGTTDQFQFAHVPMTGDGTIAARFVPQVSSQFSKFGVMMRESSAADAAHVALLLTPEATTDVERPGWKVLLTTRPAAGSDTKVASTTPNLPAPIAVHGRLMGHCWLRLTRQGTTFTGAVSSDGASWNEVGTVTASLNDSLSVGMPASSRLGTVTTTVRFDNVSAPGWPGASSTRVRSPDGKVAVEFTLQAGGVPAYEILYGGRPVVLASRLGFEPGFTNGFTLAGTASSTRQSSWTNDFGERRIVRDHCSELNVDLRHESGRLARITFRAYNEGAALRYAFPEQETSTFEFSGEWTEFRFPEDTFGYEAHGTEGEYRRARVSDIQPWCERPLTLEYASGMVASLTEAATLNHPRMLLSPLPGVRGALRSALGGETSNTSRRNQRHDPSVTLKPGESTPWRVFVLGEKAGDLLERNDLLLNLNAPLALQDTSWIRPGKVMRDTTLTTTNSKAIIDFAATGGLQYVHLDWRWYGSEDAQTGDATTVRAPNLDIQEIIRYGREKNVGLIVYVDRRQIKRQRDVLFPLFEQWGIKGVKLGFVEVGPQEEAAWMTETIRKAAEHHLMLNIHDGYRATGNNRTYPNLMTVEGIRGNEHMPTPEHNCTLPFTRYINGVGDYTVCYYDNRIKTTHAHQLAMAVVSFSPLQWIFWYDRPALYRGEPEVEFFRQVPTVWDDTKVIHGEIGKFATLARRSGDEWFVGTINNSEARELELPLDFLDPGRTYTARIYSDDASVTTRTRVGIRTERVTSATVLAVRLQSGGGQALWIAP